MKKKTITLYEYSELSAEAKKKALDNWNNDSFDDYSLQVDLDNLVGELLEKHKIKPAYGTYAKLYYSLTCSQGDGVMFEGNFDWKDYTVKIKQSGLYYHSHSKTIDMYTEEAIDVSEDDKDYISFEAIYQKICKELEDAGYAIIEDMQSEAYFIETCNANEYTFRENGRMEN